MNQSEQSLSKSIEKLYDCPLSRKEKHEAASNLIGFLSLLIEIDQSTYKKK